MAVDAAHIERAFERATALVDRLAAETPFSSVDGIIARARAIIGSMTERDLIAVLDAHPRIGADRRSLSAGSAREQGDQDDPPLLRELALLNEAYEARFGFRFVVFVVGRPRSEIVPVMRERLERTREDELTTGIDEFLAIARDRLMRA